MFNFLRRQQWYHLFGCETHCKCTTFWTHFLVPGRLLVLGPNPGAFTASWSSLPGTQYTQNTRMLFCSLWITEELRSSWSIYYHLSHSYHFHIQSMIYPIPLAGHPFLPFHAHTSCNPGQSQVGRSAGDAIQLTLRPTDSHSFVCLHTPLCTSNALPAGPLLVNHPDNPITQPRLPDHIWSPRMATGNDQRALPFIRETGQRS